MPELPEVETIVRGLSRRLRGTTLTRVLAARPDYVLAPPPSPAHHLEGRRVTAVRRHGKRLLIELDRGGRIVLHLGMSGRISVVDAVEGVAPHTHLRIALDRGVRELRMSDARRFGGVSIGAEGEPETGRNGARFTELGPDALDVPLRAWRKILSRQRGIKALLLDQSVLAGLGNIYVDEILWASRVHPLTRAGALNPERVTEVHHHLRRVLAAAIRAGGSTLRDYRDADGEPGTFLRWHKVYGRTGEPCVRCNAKIRRTLVAARSTHWCPRCQRAPGARAG